MFYLSFWIKCDHTWSSKYFLKKNCQQNFRKFFGNVAGNVIPYTGLRNQGIPFMLDQPKDVFDTRSFYDQILSKTPFTGHF